MNDRITIEFLEGNNFKKPGQVAGWTHWFYTEGKSYEVVVSPGDALISCVNYETGEQIEFRKRKIRVITKADLKRCLEFAGIKDKFNYEY